MYIIDTAKWVQGTSAYSAYGAYSAFRCCITFHSGPPSKVRLEENALVFALRNTFMPRLQGRDGSIFASLLVDLWPHTDVPLELVGQTDSSENETFAALNSKYSIKSPKSSLSHRSLRGW